MLQETNVLFLFEQRLDLKTGVHKERMYILSMQMGNSMAVRASAFIATIYEDNLMATHIAALA